MSPQAEAKVNIWNTLDLYSSCSKYFNKVSIGLKEYIVTVLIQKHVNIKSSDYLKVTKK